MAGELTDWVWLDGWQRTQQGWMVDAFAAEASGWTTRTLTPDCLVQRRRLFEPSSGLFAKRPSNSIYVRIPDMSRLSPLLEPGKVIGSYVPLARKTRHAIYVANHQGRQVYLPAALLLQILWAWTPRALDALLTPNSLGLYLSRECTEDRVQVRASGLLARVGASDTSVRRLAWLAQCADAQASWASVLTSAHKGSLAFRLPSASLDTWAWGVDLPSGFLVAELSPAPLRFYLPERRCEVMIGSVPHECTREPQRSSGYVTF